MTYSNENEYEIERGLLKLDSRGRVVISAERRADLLAEECPAQDLPNITGANTTLLLIG